ncbi:DUF1343 domain-containing protein [Candidatus Pacearchaeota archaeon]|nr:MAG: DUF1343 domain-containing protein [Candidatus Pacearchaeota archaeon]
MILYGIEVFLKYKIYSKYQKKKIALLCNQASVDFNFKLTSVIFKEIFGNNFKFIFSPQHGFFSEKQANMIGSEDEVDLFTGVPIISLYGPRLKPEKEHLDEIDTIFVDLPEVGCRVYTYIWTLYLLMSACEEAGKELIILDRPNPIGGYIEGPLLEPEYFSFVGLESIPLRHGLTIGELAILFKKRKFKNLKLEIIPMEGYKKNYFFPELKRNWIFPSPNMPSWKTALVYPGQVLLEGTNLSEGRGTTLPFLIFGAPYIKIKELQKIFSEIFSPEKDGFVLRPVVFEPTFDKWEKQRCYGFEIQVLNYKKYKPVKTTLLIMKEIKKLYSDFNFIPPPYEFERKRRPIEILLGNSQILKWLENKEEIDINVYLEYNLKNYQEEIKSYYLYE